MSYQSSSNLPPGNFITDSDSFSIPLLGGTVAVRYGTVTYEDDSETTLFYLPAGSVPVFLLCEVTEAFDDTGTDELTVGLGDDDDYFIDALNVSSTGVTLYGDTDTVAARIMTDPLEEDTAVTAIFAGQNGNADAGSANVAIFYILR